TSAAPLPAQAFDKIKAFLKSCLDGKTIEYRVDVDPELIGGFTIRIDSKLLDASLSSELRDLRLKLISKK
ncbi:MAG: F0F1 ATP synthase subunit delta, partial [Bacteroidales bacterium]|nr:F0F1 ATP synthase subunit delta [Bacteroidales bacterium]